jgi:prepilin-type N-terminal cleavage/methylation domain-containing protein
MSYGASRNGWTLVELVVVIFIIGIVSVLSVAGVQHVREASRKTDCANKLRQIGVASLNFQSSSRRFPSASWITEIAPHMELNDTLSRLENGEMLEQPISALLCPSDGGGVARTEKGIYSNFLGNNGIWSPLVESVGPVVLVDSRLEFAESQAVRDSFIVDGLSNTALFSESLRAGKGRLRTVWHMPGPKYSADEFEEFVLACGKVPNDPEADGWRGNDTAKGNVVMFDPIASPPYAGRSLIRVGLIVSMYNHVGLPQSPSCFNGRTINEAAVSSSSHHPGIVNVVFCDGRVDSVSRLVDVAVWRGYGSRDGKD